MRGIKEAGQNTFKKAGMKGEGQLAGGDPSPTGAGGPAHPDLWEEAVTPSSLE